MALRRCLRLFLTVLVLVLLLPLNACAVESPASSAAPSATAAAPPTTDPRPTPASSKGPARNLPRPVLPESAKQNTKEGFEAFTQYWFDTITYGLETGDPEPLIESSSQECKMCASYSNSIQALRESGDWQVGPTWRVRGFISDFTKDPVGRVAGNFALEESSSSTYSADRDLKRTRAGGRLTGAELVYARYEASRWRVVEAGGA
jgi:hypothetical protein